MRMRPEKDQAQAQPSSGPRVAGDEPVTITLAGRLDALRALLLRSELDELVVRAVSGARGVLVDLTEVAFIDSAALAALVRLRRQCVDAGLELALVSPRHPDAMRIFRLTQFDQVFVMLESRAG